MSAILTYSTVISFQVSNFLFFTGTISCGRAARPLPQGTLGDDAASSALDDVVALSELQRGSGHTWQHLVTT